MWLKLLVFSCLSLAVIATSPTGNWRNYLGSGQIDEEANLIKSSKASRLVDPNDGLSYRLPNDTNPLHYRVYVETEIHDSIFEFNGRVQIKVEALDRITSITLHHRQLNILNVNLLREGEGTWQSNLPHTYDSETEFLTVTPKSPITAIAAGTIFWLDITYSGVLRNENNNDQAGFYRSSYRDLEGDVHWLAVTQFESTNARHAFPCFDEPKFRTPFEISIKHHSSYEALSNMPIVRSEENDDDYITDIYQVSPSMPTYLVAFLISDFKSTAVEREFGTSQKIYAKPYSIDGGEAEFSRDVSGKILRSLESYFGKFYTSSITKMDQAAIPDFAAGAMENWGLVTYRQPLLLYNAQTDLTSNQDRIARIIAHEFAHQFMGNLATISWWGHLWLKEGFAEYYSYYILHVIEPEGGWLQSYYVNSFHYVLAADADVSIRPMTYYVESPISISELYDDIAYEKAGSVIRMFQMALTDATWRKGLNNYLTSMAYASAEPADFYAAVQLAVAQDWPTNTPNVAELMGSWEHQSGYPYLTVRRDGNSLNFEQNRFMYGDRNSENLWWIPVSYRIVGRTEADSSTAADFWIPRQRTFTLAGSSAPRQFTSSDLVLINYQQSGYYRVNYDAELWNEFIDAINDAEHLPHIPLHNRAQLIDDSFHLARANLINFDVPLKLMNYLKHEDDYLPWVVANRAHILLTRWLSGTEVHEHYQEFMRENVQTVYEKLGVNPKERDSRLQIYLRNIATSIACAVGHEDCLLASKELLEASLTSGVAIPADIATAVYCNGMRTTSGENIQSAINRAILFQDAVVKSAVFAGVGCIHDPALLKEYLEQIAAHPSMLWSEKQQAFVSALNNGAASIKIVMEIINDHFSLMTDYLITLSNSVSIRISTAELKDDFIALLVKLSGESLITTVDFSRMQDASDEILTWQRGHIDQFNYYFGLTDVEPTLPPTPPPATEPPTDAPTTPPTGETTVPPTVAPTDAPTTTDAASTQFISFTIFLVSLFTVLFNSRS